MVEKVNIKWIFFFTKFAPITQVQKHKDIVRDLTYFCCDYFYDNLTNIYINYMKICNKIVNRGSLDSLRKLKNILVIFCEIPFIQRILVSSLLLCSYLSFGLMLFSIAILGRNPAFQTKSLPNVQLLEAAILNPTGLNVKFSWTVQPTLPPSLLKSISIHRPSTNPSLNVRNWKIFPTIQNPCMQFIRKSQSHYPKLRDIRLWDSSSLPQNESISLKREATKKN